MAIDFAELIRSSFAANETSVDVIPLNPGADVEAALTAYRDSDADRLLLLDIHEWKTDVYAQVTVHWNLTARVFDRSGRMLAEESIQGTGGTGTIGGLSDEAKGRIAATEASRLLGVLLNRPAIKGALAYEGSRRGGRPFLPIAFGWPRSPANAVDQHRTVTPIGGREGWRTSVLRF